MKTLIILFVACVQAYGQATLNGSSVRIASVPPSAISGACLSSTGSDTYTCTVNSQLVYVNGMSINFRAATPSTGGATVNMSSKGARKLFAADGTSDPAVLQNIDYRISYDSTLDSGTGAWKMPSVSSGTAQLHSIVINIDGGGSVIPTGAINAYGTAKYSCTINQVDITAYPSGSITVDIWKKASGVIPTGSDKISASAPATLSSAAVSINGSLTSWTTSVASGDIFSASVASVTTVKQATVTLWCQ